MMRPSGPLVLMSSVAEWNATPASSRMVNEFEQVGDAAAESVDPVDQ